MATLNRKSLLQELVEKHGTDGANEEYIAKALANGGGFGATAMGAYSTSLVNDDYINTFLSDTGKFLTDAKSDYDSLGYSNASAIYSANFERIRDLRKRYAAISQYLRENQSKYDEDTYNSFSEALTSYRDAFDGYRNAFKTTKDYYSQWDTEEAYEKARAEWQDYYDRWGHYADEADYNDWSSKGAAIVNPTVEEAENAGYFFGKRIGGADVGNIVTYSRDNWEKLAMGEANGSRLQGRSLYHYMTDDEVGLYNYLLAKQGSEAAQSYLDDLEETLNYRMGTGQAERITGIDNDIARTAALGLYGVGAGVDQWASGTRQFVTNEKQPTSATQFGSSQIAESLDGLGGYAYQAATTVGNMAPSILVSSLFGAAGASATAAHIAGAATMGTSAAGNAYGQAMADGYSVGQARAYSTLVGASEATLQYLLGGISKLGGMSGKVAGAVANIDNTLLRVAAKFGTSISSEIVEEGLQAFLEPAFRTIIFDEVYDAPTMEELIETAIVTALSTGALEGGGIVGAEVNDLSAYKGDAEALLSMGRESENAELKALAEELTGAKLTNRQARNLDQAITGADVDTIAKAAEQRLTALGETGDVAAISRAIAKTVATQATGGQYSKISPAKSETALISGSKYGQRVMNELDPMNIASQSYSSNWTENIGTKRINSLLYNLASEVSGADASVEGNNAPVVETPSSGTLSVSDDGMTTIEDSDGNAREIHIESIASIQNGEATFTLDDGSTVKASDVSFGSQDEALVYEAVANLGGIIDTDTANRLSKHLLKLGGASSNVYVKGIVQAYTYGYYGYGREAMAGENTLSSTLTEKQRNVAYGLGEKYRDVKVAADQAKATVAKTAKVQKGKKAAGKVHFERNGRTFNEKQEVGLQTMEKLSAALGVEFHVYESYVDASGRRVMKNASGNVVPAPNGWYDPTDGSIHIDLNAGKGGEGTILFTVSHELAHFIKDRAPAKYKKFASFLVEQYGKTGQSVDELVQAQIAKAKRNGRDISYDVAFDEVVADSCETMLSSGRVMETMAQLKQQDKSLWEKICEFFKDLVEHLKAVVDTYGSLTPDSVEGRLVADMKDVIQTLESLYTEALVDASENFQTSLTPGVEGTIVNENGDPVAHSTADGYVQLSMRTYEEEGRSAFRAYLEKCVSSKRLTKAEMQEMLDGIEEIYQTCKEFKDKYAPFSTWSDAAVVRDTYGKPVFSVVTPNGDYKMNLDFSLVCKKRRTLDAVFNEMSKRGIIDNFELGQKSVVKINEIIRKYGLETACALCFVDAKRFRQASMADAFTSLYNELVYSLVPENQRDSIDHFNFAGYETIKKVEGGIDTWGASKLDFSHIDEVMKTYGSGTVEYKAAKYIKAHAEGRKLLLRGDFMSSKGFDAVKTQNQNILKLYNSKKGTGGPKAAFGDVQYLNEIIKKARTWTPAKAYAVGGVRIQSFSDYVPRMVFDYVQMIYDLAATKLPAHAYTKEALFAKQFGLTGIKINMSLIPAIAEGGIAPGLDANRDYVWAGESFDFEIAKEIQNAEGYTENCGTICVGVSDLHIRKLLGDPDIRMVIPYHKSGLNPIVAHMNKIAEFTDYTGSQNTKDRNGSKVAKDFDFNAALHKMGKNGDPKAVIQQYLEWCDKNGYTPRFSQFRDHPNYYKLIEDFTLYDKDGNYVPQREVRAVFPNADSAFGSMKELIESGLQEDAVVEGKRDKHLSSMVDEIERVLPKTEAEIEETQVEQADRDLEAEVKLSDRDYSYAALVSKPDMPVTVVGGNVPNNRADVVAQAKKNAAKIGKFDPKTGSVSVYVDDIGTDVVLGTNGLQHGLRRINKSGPDPNWFVTLKAGEVIKNAIRINKLTPSKEEATGAYVLIGAAQNSSGDFYVVRFVVNQFSNELASMDVLYAINAKRESRLRSMRPGFQGPVTDSTISIAELLDHVNQNFPDVLPEDVLKHYGYSRRPDGDLGEDALYSDRDSAPVFYSQMAKDAAVAKSMPRVIERITDEIIKPSADTRLFSYRGTNEDGIEVYETSEEIKKLPYKERQQRFLDIMANEYRGRTAKFIRNGHAYYATFEERDVNKNIYGDKLSDTKGWKAKINVGADGNIFELVENARYDGSRPEKGKNIAAHRGVGYWDYFIKTVQIDGSVFDLLANVRKKANGAFVYSIQLNQNKKIKASPPRGSLLRASSGVPNAYGDMVAHSDPEVKYSDRDAAPVFYSQMAKVVEGVKQEKLGAASVVNMLRGKGVKAEEIKWSGIETWLEGKKSVTKAELQEFIAGSMLEIREDILGGDIDLRYEGHDTYVLYDSEGNKVDTYVYSDFMNGYVSDTDDDVYDSPEELEEALRAEYLGSSAVKWKHYKLDGGENYRELVFQLPGSSYSNHAMRVHWGMDAEGVLAHARIQDFNTADGKMLFIEEIQSDWHNEGHKSGYVEKDMDEQLRKIEEQIDKNTAIANKVKQGLIDELTEVFSSKGYDLPENSAKLIYNAAVRDNSFFKGAYELYGIPEDLAERIIASTETGGNQELYAKRLNLLRTMEAGAPDAPFRSNYHEYVLKRLIRMAAEQGYDELAWTTAQIQNERWSEEYAEGYRIEYDQDIPKFLSKYGKKWGAKVGKTTLETGKTDADGNPRFDGGNYSVEVWSMEIPDAMKQSVLTEGQPLYSLRDVDPVQPTSDKWKRTLTTAEAKSRFPTLWDVSADESEVRNPTQISSTVKSYRKVYNYLQNEGFDGTILDASSGLGYGTKAGIEEYGFDVEDIEPYPDKSYKPKYTDYSKLHKKYDVIISNAVLNVLPQDQRDALTVKMGELLNEGGRIFINVRGKDVDTLASTKTNVNISPMEWFVGSTGSYQKGFTKPELVAYLQDALGDGFTVAPTSMFGAVSAIVTKKADIRYQERAEDSVSNRSLLANAFEGVAQNDIEKRKIQEYKGKIGLINSEERKLHELNEQIKELSFAKGPKDTKKIRDLQFEAKQTANRINTYDRQLLRLEASAPLQAVLDREKKLAYKKAKQEGKDALAAYRERAAKTQQELLTRYQEARHRSVESRNKTAMRHKIKDVVGELNKLLLHGTKDKHVMIGLQKAVAEALDAVNMDTVGAEERVAKYNALIAKATDPDVIASLTATRDRIQEQGDKLGDKLQRLKASYGDIKNSDDPLIANSYDEVIANRIETVTAQVGDTPLRAMTLEQLEAVYDMYKMVLTTIRNSNKAFKAAKNETISTLGNRVMEEVEAVGGKKQLVLKALRSVKTFTWDNLKPIYAFRAIGSNTFTKVFENVRAGEDTWAVDVTEAKSFYEGVAKKYGYKGWDFDKRHSFTSTTGVAFDLSLEQILSLYAYSKREQADLHLEKGGFVFDSDIEVTKKGKLGVPIKYTVNTSTAHNISKDILAAITGTLTEAQKGFVDEMQTYLSETMGEKGNEVSLEMYGVKLFKEKAYFPLKSAKQFMFEQNEAAGEVRIKNAGFSKETVAFAANPIILSNFMDVWANHVNDMSMYHAFVLPLEDFNRIFNYKTPNVENLDTESVKMYMQNAYGTDAVQYIKQLLTDLNGGVRSDPRESTGKKLVSAHKKAAVMASWSVVFQQPSAVARALAVIDAKYFDYSPKLVQHKKLWSEVKKYAPVAIIKEMGRFDTDMGRSTVDYIKGESTFMQKVDDVLSVPAAYADELTWCHIWTAVKRETMKTHKDLKPSSEEFMKAVGERFTEVIVKTQVYDSVLARSANMRSKSLFMNMVTSFMAEPTTSLNMVTDSILQGKRGNKRYAKRARRAVYASLVLNAALASIVYAGRDDDEDETWLEKYAGSFTTEILDSINPLTYLPYIKDIVSITQGYDVERSDMSLISALVEDLQKIAKLVQVETDDMEDEELAEHKKKVRETIFECVDSVASLIGVPVKNLRRDFMAAINVYEMHMRGLENDATSMKNVIAEAAKNSVPIWGWKADKTTGDKLYEAIINGDKSYVNRLKSGYETESAYNSAVRKALRENDPRIKAAAQADIDGDPSERVRIARLIIADGFSQDNVVAAINAEINALTKDDSSGSTTPKAVGLYKAADFAREIANGDQAAAYAVKDDIIQTAVKNGNTQEEAEENFISNAKSQLREEFLAGGLSEAKAIDALVDFCGNTQEEAEKKVGEWAFEAEYGFSWRDRGTAYKNGEISADELITVLMDVGGETWEDADLQVQIYDWQMEVPECDDITDSAIEDYNSYCAPAGISKSDYYDAWTTYNDTPADYDDAGDSIPYSKTVKVMPYINSLPLSADQKTALALCWWSQSTVNKYRLW